jgi:hypothetical protein
VVGPIRPWSDAQKITRESNLKALNGAAGTRGRGTLNGAAWAWGRSALNGAAGSWGGSTLNGAAGARGRGTESVADSSHFEGELVVGVKEWLRMCND